MAAVAAAAVVASATSRRVRFHESYAMRRVYPRRGLAVVAVIVLSGCSATHKAPAPAVPQVEAGKASVRAIGAVSLGPVQPVAGAVTNGLAESIRVDGRQAFALTESGDRIAPLPPREATRLARGRGVPGSRNGAGAVTGGMLGAMRGAISGAKRALPATSVSPGLPATRCLHYPEGSYQTLELLLTEDASGRVMPERVPVAPDE